MIGCKLVLFANRKLHAGFRLVPKTMTLNGVMVVLWCFFVILAEARPILAAIKILHVESSFWRCMVHSDICGS